MSGRFTRRADFHIAGAVFDEHEWVTDEFIDGDIGSVCTLIFPPKQTQCDNCLFDRNSRKSSNIYNGTGAIPFTNNTLCPRCNGVGRLSLPLEQTIRLRTYFDKRSFIDIGLKAANPDGLVMTIGYMSDLKDLEKADKILLNSNLDDTRKYLCVREGEAVPHGFRRNRYFIQYLRRTGGGQV